MINIPGMLNIRGMLLMMVDYGSVETGQRGDGREGLNLWEQPVVAALPLQFLGHSIRIFSLNWSVKAWQEFLHCEFAASGVKIKQFLKNEEDLTRQHRVCSLESEAEILVYSSTFLYLLFHNSHSQTGNISIFHILGSNSGLFGRWRAKS